MLENFFVNLKSKINLTKRNGNNCDGSEKENNAPATARQMLDDLLPNRKVRYTTVSQNDEFRESRMLPRVTHGDDNAWGPVDLAPKEKFVEDMDNVIDKFIRVIRADSHETGALRNSNKRNDREEIRRRLAMGSDYDYFGRTHSDRPTRKPSLHSRLQGGMNLQICFMNETASDNESPSSDSESCPKLSKSFTFSNNSTGNAYSRYNSTDSHPYNSRPLSVNVRKSSSTEKASRPSSLPIGPKIGDDSTKDVDFFTKQARLQIEARMALAQAKDMAHMQMEIDRQKQKQSPITEIIRNSLEKVGITFPEEKRRVSRLMLTDMNIAQLQVIVNEFHTQIERLNENLVQFLMERDDLHMSQDSMLVDIEDLTRYLLAKEQTTDKQNNQPAILTTPTQEIVTKDHIVKTTATTATNRPQTQSKLLRITNLVKK